MKKDINDLEKRIIDTALRMFNERGIEYVGMRELAGELGIRIGNLNYYFPTKDDLVNRISLELARENSATIVAHENVTMPIFFGMLQQVFRNQLKYRCLMLSFVHVIQRNAVIAKRYNKTVAERNATWSNNINGLSKSKQISADQTEIDFLVSTIALIARFWISESAVSFRDKPEAEQIDHYLRMTGRIFLPYSIGSGRKYLSKWLFENAA